MLRQEIVEGQGHHVTWASYDQPWRKYCLSIRRLLAQTCEMYLQLQHFFAFLSFEQSSPTNSSINPCHSLVSAVLTNQPERFLSFCSF